mgnify:CR=1 FL=1
MAGLFDRLAHLEIEVDSLALERLEFETVRWVRVSTVAAFENLGQGTLGRRDHGRW